MEQGQMEKKTEGMPAYKDASLTPHERALDLLKRMTLREKVGQLNQRLYGFRIYERNGNEVTLTEEFCKEVETFGGIGTLYGLYRADPWAARTEENGITVEWSKEIYNKVQRYVIEHSRLGIPMLLSSECPHGHQALDGALLPVNLAAGASFDPELLKEGYKACGKQLASAKVDMALMSVLDILRDPRWGRSEECYSEDPFLSACMAAAAVEGMQSTGVSSVAKHFCAQGETTGGINASAARIGERELREIHFPAAKACCEVGVDGIMAAYNEIDGIYCHANEWLLRTVLREEMGFKGVVMADGLAIDYLKKAVGDVLHAAAAALKAGVDISLWDEAFSYLDQAVEAGFVEESVLDEAVLRVLEMKFSRGLFDKPYMEENMISAKESGVEEISLEIARESAILLKNNNNILPFKNKFRKIAVIGYQAADRYGQLGDYTPPVKPEACMTVVEGMYQFAPEGVQVEYATGCGFFEELPEEKEKAVKLAQNSDVAVVVLGGSSSRFGGAIFDDNGAAISGSGTNAMDCGEGMDCASLHIPKAQEDLLKAVKACGKPVVAVVIAGRPYVLEDVVENAEALLYTFYPGPWGGRAAAEILYGLKNPSGRLPVSIPRHVGQVPVYYNVRSSYETDRYYDVRGVARFRFGEGMSYTKFDLNNAKAEVKEDGVHVTFCIKNIGETEGCAVPMLYIHKMIGPVIPRVLELKAFERISLAVGEEKQVELIIPNKELTCINYQKNEVAYYGDLELFLKEGGQHYWNETITLRDMEKINKD